jgi:hypothetical protein
MMIGIGMKSNIAEIAALLGVESKETINAAAVSALNKTAAKAKTASARQIRDAGYRLKVSDIKDNITVRKAWKSRMVASVNAKGRPIPLIDFFIRQAAEGCIVNIKGQAKLLRHTFVATMPNGHKGIFSRRSKSRLPIDQVFTVGIPEMFMTHKVNDQLRKQITEDFPKIFRGELSWKAFKQRR